MNNQLELVTLKQAQKLKETNFDWPTDFFYERTKKGDFVPSSAPWPSNWNGREIERISIPTVALALKWFRDVKKQYVYIEQENIIYGKHYGEYERAEFAALDYLLTTPK